MVIIPSEVVKTNCEHLGYYSKGLGGWRPGSPGAQFVQHMKDTSVGLKDEGDEGLPMSLRILRVPSQAFGMILAPAAPAEVRDTEPQHRTGRSESVVPGSNRRIAPSKLPFEYQITSMYI